MKNKCNPAGVITPEEAMKCYFGDFFNESGLDVPDKDDLPSARLEFISSASVAPGYGLIATSNLNDRIVDFSQAQRALVESFILLLWGLYFLRKPISGKLRAHVLDYCNEMSMEYHLLLDLAYARPVTGEGE